MPKSFKHIFPLRLNISLEIVHNFLSYTNEINRYLPTNIVCLKQLGFRKVIFYSSFVKIPFHYFLSVLTAFLYDFHFII